MLGTQRGKEISTSSQTRAKMEKSPSKNGEQNCEETGNRREVNEVEPVKSEEDKMDIKEIWKNIIISMVDIKENGGKGTTRHERIKSRHK